jgi:F-type H+-transporting ATPase subunit delta
MVNETLARRYAMAVFSLAQDANAVERVGNDLSGIARSLRTDDRIHEFFVSPVVDRKEKEKILARSFQGHVHDIALHTVILLVRKRRESLLDTLVAEYRKLELQARGAEPLTVTTARELAETDLRAMIDRLERIYGKKFDATVRHDASLIGGVCVTMGDRRIDGTVAGRLEELTRMLFTGN